MSENNAQSGEARSSVYFIRANTSKWCRVKIGYAKDVEARVSFLQTGSPLKLILMGSIPCRSLKHAQSLEASLHKTFAEYRCGGEWFNLAAPLREFIVASIAGDIEASRKALDWGKERMARKASHRARGYDNAYYREDVDYEELGS